MRDLVLFIIVFGAIPYMLRHPYIGVLMWSWLSYMNPHKLSWSYAYSFPFAQVVAIVMLISLLGSKEKKNLPSSPIVGIWLLFIIWMGISTANAFYPEDALLMYIKIIKIQLIVFLTMMIMQSPERIKLMVWVIYLSIGFFGIKGGVFTALNGGNFRVWGPPTTFIEDNNHLAVALLMVLPLGYYLAMHEARNIWIKRALLVSLPLVAISAIGSQSRGALLAIICVAFYLWLKTKKKIVTAILVLPLLPLMFMFMPESWHERMDTIKNYEQDRSAMGRINAWSYSVNAANDNITGVGLESWTKTTFAIWAPNPRDVHAAHSIYFSVIADHGWIGFLMFFTIFTSAFFVAGKIIRQCRGREEYAWAEDLTRMIQVSIVAYATGGAFLSMSYFDLPWHLVAIILLLQQYLQREGVMVSRGHAKPIRQINEKSQAMG